MTYETLYKLCQRQSGNKSADALIGFKDYLNLGQKDVAGSYDNWRELNATGTLSLTDGIEAYALTNFDRFRTDVLLLTSPTNNEKPIYRISANKLREQNPVTSNDSETIPVWWYEDPNDDTKIRFYPIPDTSYTVSYDYITTTTDMNATSDSPFFPARWHHILVDYALAMHFESAAQRNYDVATYHWTKYRNGLKQLISNYKQRFIGQGTIEYGSGINE